MGLVSAATPVPGSGVLPRAVPSREQPSTPPLPFPPLHMLPGCARAEASLRLALGRC